jgi:hypothetical protein
MPQKLEVDIEWKERYAWWPVRSSWSKKRIWFRKYWEGDIYNDAMGRPPIKASSWKLIYTENEYLLMLLREDEKYQHLLSYYSGRSGPRAGY